MSHRQAGMHHSVLPRQAEVRWTPEGRPQLLAYHAQSQADVSLLHLPAGRAEGLANKTKAVTTDYGHVFWMATRTMPANEPFKNLIAFIKLKYMIFIWEGDPDNLKPEDQTMDFNKPKALSCLVSWYQWINP